MTLETPYVAVKPTSEARTELASALTRFRRDGVGAEPLIFGNHRRAEGVVLPFELYRAVYGAIEEVRETALLRDRINDGKPRVSLEDVIDELGYDRADFNLDQA